MAFEWQQHCKRLHHKDSVTNSTINTPTRPIKKNNPPKRQRTSEPVLQNGYAATAFKLISINNSPPAYLSGRNHWIIWRTARGKPKYMGTDRADNLEQIVWFMMYFLLEAPNVNSWSTVEQYLMHVKDMHNTLLLTQIHDKERYEWPGTLSSLLDVVSRRAARAMHCCPQPEGGRLPCTPGLLEYLIRTKAMDISSHDGKRFFTILLLTMLGGFRVGELIPLTISDEKRNIHKDCKIKNVIISEDSISITVLGKNTKKMELQTVVVTKAAAKDLVDLFGEEFNVFRLLKEIVLNLQPEEFIFKREDNKVITYDYFYKGLVAITRLGNIPDGHFGGHSGRIYFASLRALQGAEDSEIKTDGRWKSDAFLLYVRAVSKRQFDSAEKIRRFCLADLNFTLVNFPMDKEFRK